MMENLLPHQKRVVDELSALIEKIDRLDEFTETTVALSLAGQEFDLLIEQLRVMQEYANVLNARLEYWGIEI